MINTVMKVLKVLAVILALVLLGTLSGIMANEMLHLFAKEVAKNISTQCK
jgi:hypothetical protein